jgi:hypothetical protein
MKDEAMRNDGHCRLALAVALAPLILAGCATSGAASGGAVTKAATTAAAQPVAQPTLAATHATRPVQPLAPPTELELQAGIQIMHIGVTASGGLVDARFKVLDGAKATALLAIPANAPMLVAGDKPPLMAPHHAIKGGRFAKDQLIYILYPNLRGAVQPGTEVSVTMGQTRIGPVTAQ